MTSGDIVSMDQAKFNFRYGGRRVGQMVSWDKGRGNTPILTVPRVLIKQ